MGTGSGVIKLHCQINVAVECDVGRCFMMDLWLLVFCSMERLKCLETSMQGYEGSSERSGGSTSELRVGREWRKQ